MLLTDANTGSEYKIDASYLSPNVNLASRLEAATKQYGVSLLLSAAFVDCLSTSVRSRVRQVDCVTVKGSTQPMGLYTYDLDVDLAAKMLMQLRIAGAAGGRCSTDNIGVHAAIDKDSGAGGTLPPGRTSLAVLPGAAGAARSSVVMLPTANEGGGAESDDAEV